MVELVKSRFPPEVWKRIVAAAFEDAAKYEWMKAHPIPRGPTPPRPWGDSREADRGAPWWGVQRLGPHGRFSVRAMFRHVSLEAAQREAQFLAEHYPGGVFAIVQMVELRCVGAPEVSVGKSEQG